MYIINADKSKQYFTTAILIVEYTRIQLIAPIMVYDFVPILFLLLVWILVNLQNKRLMERSKPFYLN